MNSLSEEIQHLITLLEKDSTKTFVGRMTESKQNDKKSNCGDLSNSDLLEFEKNFKSDDKNLLTMNILTKTETKKVLLKRDSILKNQHVYNVKISDEAKPVTAQHSTGRCWLFAALNVMRIPFMKELGLTSFEFSQSYLFFWDKLERCNFFLEQIIDTVKEPLTGRLVQFLLNKPQEDGGQYDMIVNIVEKYGVVPKDVYPEVPSTDSSLVLRRILNKKLRDYAYTIRNMDNNDTNKMRKYKKECMNEIYRIMVLHFGIPPSKFSWSYYNKDKEYKSINDVSPLEFYNKYVRKFINVTDMVSIVNDPRNEYYKLYTVDRLNNILNGARDKVLYINLPIDKLKEYCINKLKDNKPVWFGCHVSQEFERNDGIMDNTQFDYKTYLNIEFKLNKAQRLDYCESLMTHAMVFTGVELDNNNKPIRWRVENSWGDKRGHNGYCLMTDEWFNEYNYQICIDKQSLSKEIQDILNQKPIVLPPWDPMGSLANYYPGKKYSFL